MGFTIENSVPAITVFLQGIISFLSPCILPLVPLYITYLSGGTKEIREDGSIYYPRKRVLINTLFFVIGISVVFFLLGFSFTALGSFFDNSRMWFARISGIIMILFGLYQFGLFGQSSVLEREHRLPFHLSTKSMGPATAFLLGFTFSFSWTPCVGPVLGSVLLMASSSGSSFLSLTLIIVYTAGFILPFLAVGFFTGSLLNFFGKYKNVVRYTVKIGAILMILMGVMTLTGFMNGFTNYLSNTSGTKSADTQKETPGSNSSGSDDESSDSSDTSTSTAAYASDLSFTDQYGTAHSLRDYKGKTVFLNFWATWCPPCKSEMPHIQALYEEYGENTEDVIILGAAAPGNGQEGTIDNVKNFLSDNEYTFPVLMDDGNDLFSQYKIQAFPTTFMIDKDGNIFGYVEGALTKDTMQSIIKQTMEGK